MIINKIHTLLCMRKALKGVSFDRKTLMDFQHMKLRDDSIGERKGVVVRALEGTAGKRCYHMCSNETFDLTTLKKH